MVHYVDYSLLQGLVVLHHFSFSHSKQPTTASCSHWRNDYEPHFTGKRPLICTFCPTECNWTHIWWFQLKYQHTPDFATLHRINVTWLSTCGHGPVVQYARVHYTSGEIIVSQAVSTGDVRVMIQRIAALQGTRLDELMVRPAFASIELQISLHIHRSIHAYLV